MTDKPIDLEARRKAKAADTTETSTDSPNLKPQFDPDTYFAEIMKANARAKDKAVEDKAKHNKLTKRRYRIEDKEK